MIRCLPLALLYLSALSGQTGRLRALILSGQNNHDWRSTTPQLRKLLTESGRFEVRVTEEPSGLNAKLLSGYDLLVLDYNGPSWGAPAESAMKAFVRDGKGIVIFHAASDPIGGWSVNEHQGETQLFDVRITAREHPVVKNMPETFTAADHPYRRVRMHLGAQPIATALDAPVLWVSQVGKGRAFHTALGHDLAAMQEPGFIATLLRGAEWAASGAVTLPPDAGSRHAEGQVRVALVTGGHVYDNPLHVAFEDPAMKVLVVPHPSAFRADMRKNIDVLVLYDMVQDPDEQKRIRLREFFEAGKGVVVMHHALVSYNDWPWYREAAGAVYFLKPEGDRPPSSFKHDQIMRVRVEARHPVTAGLPPMRIIDETYKGMWFAPTNQVLLTTDHPDGDGPVAWISAYPKSRVVGIQLGHGREAHLHPGFQRLVRNAVLWAAGRDVK
jgi:type 1 glutamine amidotransferase